MKTEYVYCRPSFVIHLCDLLGPFMSLGVNIIKKSLFGEERWRGWLETVKKSYFSLIRSLQFHWNTHGVRVRVLVKITMIEIWIQWIDFQCISQQMKNDFFCESRINGEKNRFPFVSMVSSCYEIAIYEYIIRYWNKFSGIGKSLVKMFYKSSSLIKYHNNNIVLCTFAALMLGKFQFCKLLSSKSPIYKFSQNELKLLYSVNSVYNSSSPFFVIYRIYEMSWMNSLCVPSSINVCHKFECCLFHD